MCVARIVLVQDLHSIFMSQTKQKVDFCMLTVHTSLILNCIFLYIPQPQGKNGRVLMPLPWALQEARGSFWLFSPWHSPAGEFLNINTFSATVSERGRFGNIQVAKCTILYHSPSLSIMIQKINLSQFCKQLFWGSEISIQLPGSHMP